MPPRDSISKWSAFDEATMRTDARSSDEEHEPLPHRQGEEAEAERMLESGKQWGRRRYVEISDQFLEFLSRASSATMESHRPSRAQESIMLSRGLDLATTRTRACELFVKVAVEHDSQEACEI